MSDGADPGADEPGSDEPGSRRRGEPPGLKDLLGPADDTDVLDGIGGRQRLTWDAVTDAGGAPVDVDRETPTRQADGSSFQFDLGGALARLASDDPAPGGAPSATPPPERPEGRTEERPTAPAAPSAHSVAPSHEPPPVAEPGPQRASEASAAPSPSSPMSPPVTRPIEPMTSEAVGREPTTPPVANPGAPLPSRLDQPPPADSTDPAPPPNEYPRRVPGTHLESQMRAAQEAVPEIREATPSDAAPRQTSRSSVFEDLGSTTTSAAPPTLPAATPNMAVSAPPEPPAAPTPAPAFSSANLPSLPASNPAAPPPVAEPISTAPSTPDINALRSAQLRASKQQHQGRLFGRSLLAFVVVGGLIAAALVFGRSLLFDTAWDAQLTPIVNEIEADRGQFDHAVPLVVVPAAELGERLQAATIGDAWIERVPEWRALGLATGAVDAESVGLAMAESTTAIYDPESDQIYQLEGVDAADGEDDLRVALERAFQAQTGATPTEAADVAEEPDPVDSTGVAGVSSLESIATRAVDRVLALGGSVSGRRSADETLPIPIAYELAAVDVLGEPILSAIGLDPAAHTPGDPYPETIATVLDDEATDAPSALIQPGEVALAAPRALGTDDWSLIWATRLPTATVDQLVTAVVADSYRPVTRDGTTCFVAVFDTANEASGNSTFASLLTWTANAPAASQAVAMMLAPTRVQLEACDPGVGDVTPPNAGVADGLIDRQQLRLTS